MNATALLLGLPAIGVAIGLLVYALLAGRKVVAVGASAGDGDRSRDRQREVEVGGGAVAAAASRGTRHQGDATRLRAARAAQARPGR